MAAPTKSETFQRPLTEGHSAEVKIDLNPIAVKIVNRLLKSGLHGNTPRQVVMRLVDESLRNHETP